MNIASERPQDEVRGVQAVDLVATLHEKLLERCRTKTIRERFTLEDIAAVSLGTSVHVSVKFRTADGPAEMAFVLPWEQYALVRRKLHYIKAPGRRLRDGRAQSSTAARGKRGR